jgi:transcriptional regulator with XRE-family HTH domain
MSRISLQALGRKLLEKRADRGIREVAAEIGVSPATLSRVERGFLPDVETFGKVCRWLEIDPGEVLGVSSAKRSAPMVGVHFRKKETLAPGTAKALAQMILAAQRALLASGEGEMKRV